MDEFFRNIVTLLANVALIAVTVGGLAVWVTVVRRVRQRQVIVPYSPRRQVPWTGLDVFAILFGYLLVASLLIWSADHFFHRSGAAPGKPQQVAAVGQQDSADPAEEAEEEAIDARRAHPIVVLLNADTSIPVLILCLLSVVVMAPLGEEFFFRLLLQGYLEKVDTGFRRVLRYPGRLIGIWPILLSSLLFAALHARDPREELPPVDQLIALFAIDAFSKAIVVLVAIGYLREFRGATWEDLGLQGSTFWTDLRLALSAFLAVFIPIIALQFSLAIRFPDSVPDPVPLFPLALVLGYLYFRTHRIMPALLLHLLFNAASMIMFFATMAAQ